MRERTPYEQAVVGTFRERALRTVLVFDDQFPTYADLIERSDTALAEFRESARAGRLYRYFHSLQMPCDVENDVRILDAGQVERIRKSDLIVLDYHLTATETDTSHSTRIICQLADTKHFNTVVLYTREPDLERVWLDLACSLRGGWCEPRDLLAALPAASLTASLSQPNPLTEWNRLEDGDVELPDPPVELLRAYVTADVRDPAQSFRSARPEYDAMMQELQALGVHPRDCKPIVEALVHRAILGRVAERTYRDAPTLAKAVRGQVSTDGSIWLQSDNCFVALMRKAPELDAPAPTEAAEATGAEVRGPGSTAHTRGVDADPEGIIDGLDRALIAWAPSYLQIVISEIQNLLELEALATEDAHLRDPETLVGLSYYVLAQARGVEAPWPADALGPVTASVIEKLVEGLRRRVTSDPALATLATDLLSHELGTSEWPASIADRRHAATFAAAARLARLDPAPKDDQAALLRLNVFLATEPFRRSHLTTGTIFKRPDTNEHWVCVSPACDMVPRLPGTHQEWTHAIHPVRPMVVIALKPVDVKKALAGAEHGRYVFLERPSGVETFTVLSVPADQPSYEFLFPSDAGQVAHDTKAFDAYSVRATPAVASAVPRSGTAPPAVGPVTFDALTYEVVGQLRPSYANRFLQMIGQHLSRIGLDFVRLSDA